MSNSLKDWDNRRKYEKLPYQKNLATIGHLEYLHKQIGCLSGEPVSAVLSTGIIDGSCGKNTFRYKGDSDATYQLPDPTLYPTNGIFVINKTTFILTIEGTIWDFTASTQREVSPGEIVYFISDGEHWTIYN